MLRWEYWNIHLLLLPVYGKLLFWCLLNRFNPLHLLKADYALDHGGATFVSKYAIQFVFSQKKFPPTTLIPASESDEAKLDKIQAFAKKEGFPLVLKPDIGRVGLGVIILQDKAQASKAIREIHEDYILQKFAHEPLEYGVFYIRDQHGPRILGINSKSFPEVVGDGIHNVATLIEKNWRLRRLAPIVDKTKFHDVLPAGQKLRLSNIGSHTLGCTFYDVSDLITAKLLKSIDNAVGVDGFHYGRLDIRCQSIEHLKNGEFVIIEVNGVESLATHAFDPQYSYIDGLRIFHEQFRALFNIAKEHRDKHMELMPVREFFKNIVQAETGLKKFKTP